MYVEISQSTVGLRSKYSEIKSMFETHLIVLCDKYEKSQTSRPSSGDSICIKKSRDERIA